MPALSKLKRCVTCHFVELVRPGCYWPYPYSVEQALGVLAWMVRSAQELDTPERQRQPWVAHAVKALLSCQPTCTGMTSIRPVVSLGDLKRRFHYALLDIGNDSVDAWREAFDIRVGGQQRIWFPHYGYQDAPWSQAVIEQRLTSLLKAQGKLAVQLNQSHRRARQIVAVRLHLSSHTLRWSFVLDYGYGGSVWHHDLAEQQPGEPWVDTLLRAERDLERLKTGKELS